MSLKLNTSSGGSITVAPTNTASNFTLTVPAATGTVITNKTAGTVLQVVHGTSTSSMSMSTGQTWTDISGASVSITPSSASNKILVDFVVNGGLNTAANCWFRLVRNGTPISIGDSNGSAAQSSASSLYQGSFGANRDNNYMLQATGKNLDSPSSTSEVVYKLQAYIQTGVTLVLGRLASQLTDASAGTAPSWTLTVMEIAG